MNTALTDSIIKIFNIKPASNEKMQTPIPIVDVDVINVLAYIDTNTTIYAVPSKGRFYLHGVEISTATSAASTGLLAYVSVVIGGKTVRIAHVASEAGLNAPAAKYVNTGKVLIDPGTNIALAISGTFTQKHATIYGTYYPE